jgi:hypothetical protein
LVSIAFASFFETQQKTLDFSESMEYTDSRRGKPPRAVVSNGARALNFGVGLFFFTHLRGKAEAFSSYLGNL